ncbi:primosomal replication protein [Thaumasiovibrio subtropicus]|uniref:primosomal replication protein n=1 Tax=Thaumasiovibrio subtropicus TaxID=1891207 RepID=UPI000B354291|nr:primosomal replication protein [Thaumasiovibrio subtropicus]
MNIQRFHQHLSDLRQQAIALDSQRGESHKPLFDEQLFSGHPKLLGPCVEQAQYQLSLVEKCLTSDAPDPVRLGYLCDHLALQIHGLQREIATTKLRAVEPRMKPRFHKSLVTLRQDLAQHLEWERRLLQMCKSKQQDVEHAPAIAVAQEQQALLAVEGRLERCRAAKLKLEKQIHYQERYE